MQEITLEPAEIKLIDPRRTSLVPAVPMLVDPAPIQQTRNMAVIRYVLPAGPL